MMYFPSQWLSIQVVTIPPKTTGEKGTWPALKEAFAILNVLSRADLLPVCTVDDMAALP